MYIQSIQKKKEIIRCIVSSAIQISCLKITLILINFNKKKINFIQSIREKMSSDAELQAQFRYHVLKLM